MQTSAEAVYLDSSAIVKLVVSERESTDLSPYLDGRRLVSCALARTEVYRAVRLRGADAPARVRSTLEGLYLIRLDDQLLGAAAEIDPIALRTLDAIHLAAAQSLGGTLAEVVTYDRRMAEAAASLGMTVVAPGRQP